MAFWWSPTLSSAKIPLLPTSKPTNASPQKTKHICYLALATISAQWGPTAGGFGRNRDSLTFRMFSFWVQEVRHSELTSVSSLSLGPKET